MENGPYLAAVFAESLGAQIPGCGPGSPPGSAGIAAGSIANQFWWCPVGGRPHGLEWCTAHRAFVTDADPDTWTVPAGGDMLAIDKTR